MKQKGLWFGFLVVLMLSVPAAVSGGQDPAEIYFGHISYLEPDSGGMAPLVFREGRSIPETAALNLPLGPGDMIQTLDGPRCEVQFDNGTIVRLDRNTKLKIETVLARSLSTAKRVSNLLLAQGQVYVMHKKYNSLEIFQVITPQAAVKLSHNSVALIQLPKEWQTAVQLERGKADLLYGPDQSQIQRKKVEAQRRMVISGDPYNVIEPAEYIAQSDFKAWNDAVNANFKALHEENMLPKPVQNLPPAVFYFAQRYGSLYGEWIWHDLYGYVWRPYFNNYYPWGTWAPYIYGNWESYRGQLFWIPGEPWGWVPYHLGLWMWDKNKGWVWMPGSMFATAWAVWDFYSGYYSWRPWFLWDWMYLDDYLTSGSNWGSGIYWDYYVEPGTGSESGVPASKTLRAIRKDQLKKKNNPSLPLPKEMKKSLNAAMNALKRGDENALASLRGVSRQSVYMKAGDLASSRWQAKSVGLDRVLKNNEGQLPAPRTEARLSSLYVSAAAQRAIQRRQIVSEMETRLNPAKSDLVDQAPLLTRVFQFNPERIEGVDLRRMERGEDQPGHSGSMDSARRPGLRFRDWNPDVQTGIHLGVDIRYDSRRNEVIAPELGLRSGDTGPRMRIGEGQFSSPSSPGREGFAVEPGQSAPTQGPAAEPARKEPSSSGGEVKKKEG